MADFLNTDTWARRAAFEYFRGFDKPCFSVCMHLEAAPLKAAAKARAASFSSACHFVALRLANRHVAFRQRLESGRLLRRALRQPLAALALVAAAPALAACPPPGETAASLQALKAAPWQRADLQADAAARDTLALALLACLDDPDPALRDGIAFELLQAGLRGGSLGGPVLQQLRQRLQARLAAPPDEAGFGQPFAALVLAEVARVDRLKPYLSAEERASLVDSAVAYLAGVRDRRGFDAREGWRHGVAHGADLMLQLSLNPALQRSQADAMLQAIASQVLPVGTHAWVYGEPARLAAPVFQLARRGLLTAEDWQRWFEGLTRRPTGETGMTPAGLARRHNLQAFLTLLYTTVQESAAPEPKALLLPALRQALRASD